MFTSPRPLPSANFSGFAHLRRVLYRIDKVVRGHLFESIGIGIKERPLSSGISTPQESARSASRQYTNLTTSIHNDRTSIGSLSSDWAPAAAFWKSKSWLTSRKSRRDWRGCDRLSDFIFSEAVERPHHQVSMFGVAADVLKKSFFAGQLAKLSRLVFGLSSERSALSGAN